MGKFKVRIVETLVRDVEVEAKDRYEAVDKVREMWLDEHVILGSGDFSDIEMFTIGQK